METSHGVSERRSCAALAFDRSSIRYQSIRAEQEPLLHRIRTLSRITAKRGAPKTIRVDNGPEFISKALDLCAYANGVTLDFSRPGKPTDNAFIESFNGPLRDDPKGGAARVLTQTDSCLWTTLEARSRRGDETIMRSVLTHPWAG